MSGARRRRFRAAPRLHPLQPPSNTVMWSASGPAVFVVSTHGAALPLLRGLGGRAHRISRAGSASGNGFRPAQPILRVTSLMLSKAYLMLRRAPVKPERVSKHAPCRCDRILPGLFASCAYACFDQRRSGATHTKNRNPCASLPPSQNSLDRKRGDATSERDFCRSLNLYV